MFVEKILCIGNNHEITDKIVHALSVRHKTKNHGLVNNTREKNFQSGFYHTSIVDLNLAEIESIAPAFDKILVLDIEKKYWNHPDEFYLTKNLADRLETNFKVEWQNSNSGNHIDYWKNLVSENKSFCIFPFIELWVDNEYTRLCCRSDIPIEKINNLDWVNSPNLSDVRTKMIKGELLPKHCKQCYDYEKLGMLSARQQETVEWANRLKLSSTDDLKLIEKPVYYEIRPSNKCNLMCRTCVPKFSSLIEKEYINNNWIQEVSQIKRSNFDIVDLNNLKKLYVAGGEPTAMIEFYEFLDTCIANRNTDFEFVVNSNCAKISDSLLNKFSHFSNLSFIASVDGYKKVNDYTRWLSEWNKVIENINKLRGNHQITFNVTVSIYTVSSLYKLLAYLDKNFADCLVHCGIAIGPNISPFIFPDSKSILSQVDKMKTLNCVKKDNLLLSFVEGLGQRFKTNQIDTTELKKFFEFNDKLDQSRSSRLKDYIPELDKFRLTYQD